MRLKKITTKDGDVYFVDSKTGERIKTPNDDIKSELGKEIENKAIRYESISIKKLLFSYQGRINGGVFFVYGLLTNIIFASFLILFLVYVPINKVPGGEYGLIFFAVLLDLFFSVPAIVKRFHDINYSGAFTIVYLLLMLIPVINVIAAIAILVVSGSNNKNNYGLPTKLILSKHNLIIPIALVFGIFSFWLLLLKFEKTRNLHCYRIL